MWRYTGKIVQTGYKRRGEGTPPYGIEERSVPVAKFEKRLTGNFDEFLQKISDSVLNGSMSASYEDGSDWTSGEVRCAVRVFERYSMAGGNRVSMNVTLVGKGEELFLTAITSGGSQAVFWKINTMGEEAFLQTLIDAIN